jgi:hypothetical protein
VVDPEELRLVEVLVEVGRQRDRRVAVMAKRLLDDDAGVRGRSAPPGS